MSFPSSIISPPPSLWQYGLWSFQTGGTKLERFLPKKKHPQKKKKASQCGYVVSTLASCQGDPGSNPRAARKSCEVYPGLGILQPQWNPYPTLTPPSC